MGSKLTEQEKEIAMLQKIAADKDTHIVSHTRVGKLMKRGLVVWNHEPGTYGWYLTDAGRAALASANKGEG